MQNKNRFLKVAAMIAALCGVGNAVVPNKTETTNGPKTCDNLAEVEVFIVGGGGGGEGGHSRYCMLDEYQGTGSSGGGGAATWAKLRVPQGSTFEIAVGNGGAGGQYRHTKCGENWGNGLDGQYGRETTVEFTFSAGDITKIIAGGGHGGGFDVGGENMDGGGAGGTPGITNYTRVIDSRGVSGNPGSNGQKKGDNQNITGGNAGSLENLASVYLTSFGGGLGGKKNNPARDPGIGGGGNAQYYNAKGVDGGIGMALVYVTYLWNVTFNSNGGSPNPSTISEILNGTRIIEPSKPAKEYHVFNGWFKNPDCTDKWYFENPVTQSMTLYAGWLDTRYGDTLGVP
ncbi:MAG: InlB B-repeat-containing protein, partial [Chitinispirillales bacterium]|nr:InlB B-repeat-containing protein [Chitinispirillales bacterium]